MTTCLTRRHDRQLYHCGGAVDASGALTGTQPTGEAGFMLRTGITLYAGQADAAGRSGPVAWRDHREGLACLT